VDNTHVKLQKVIILLIYCPKTWNIVPLQQEGRKISVSVFTHRMHKQSVAANIIH